MPTSRAIVALAVVAIVAGVFFRFYHLDRKVYWGDETYSSMRMLGELEGDLVARAPSYRTAGDLDRVLHPNPPYGTADPFSPARVLAIEEQHHPPLYFEIAHFWVGGFGNAIGTARLLSALVSLLALPCAFWLAYELFGSREAGWIAVSLVALSPVAITYAQQAREYALWSVAILTLSAAVLRAIRRDRVLDWCLVGLMLALSLWTFPLTLAFAGGLACYVVATQYRNPAIILHASLAFGFGVVAYIPWLIVLAVHASGINTMLETTLSAKLAPVEVMRAFAALPRLDVIDLNFVSASKFGAASTAAVLVATVLAVVVMIQRQPPRIWLFLVLPLLTATLPLVLPDLLFSGQRVRSPRYFVPAYLCLDLIFAALFAVTTATTNAPNASRWIFALIALLSIRAASATASSHAVTWWSTYQDNSVAVASVINNAPAPLVVSDAYLGYQLVLANYLRPGVRLVIRPTCYECFDKRPPQLDAALLPPGRFTDVYALGPSSRLQRLLRMLLSARNPKPAYHCINIRNNCASTLNIEPLANPGRNNFGNDEIAP